jgi:OOP family OmpA-OmpF porin
MTCMGRTAVLAVALLSGGAARAAGDGSLYLYGAAGAVKTIPGIDQGSTDAIVQSTGPTDVSSSVDQGDIAYKLQLGWSFTKNFAIEAGYVNLGSVNYYATFTGGTAIGDSKTKGLVLDLVGIVPISNVFSVFAKFGYIDAKVTTSLNVTGPNPVSSNSEDTMFKPNFGVGVIYGSSKSAMVRIELERFSKLGSDSTGGTSDTNMISIGLVVSR